MIDVKCVWEEPAILGEGPLWVERENAVYWVDIVSRKVHRYGTADGSRRSRMFEEQVTSLSARQQGGFVGTVHASTPRRPAKASGRFDKRARYPTLTGQAGFTKVRRPWRGAPAAALSV